MLILIFRVVTPCSRMYVGRYVVTFRRNVSLPSPGYMKTKAIYSSENAGSDVRDTCVYNVAKRTNNLVKHCSAHEFQSLLAISQRNKLLSVAVFRVVTPCGLLGGFPSGGGGSCLYEGLTYFERNMDARWNKYFGRHFAWLKYFAYHLVPLLAPNCKQHI
jgi:hypothetical protein